MGPARAGRTINIIFMTIWDGGGVDTYDFSSYTKPISIDLRPGEWTNPGLTAPGGSFFQLPVLGLDDELGFVNARGSIANAYLFNGDTRSLIENANGGAGNDILIGNQANNTLRGNGGDDTLFYTSGNDALFGDARGDNGDTADFSMASSAVIINPVAVFQTLTIGGRTLTSSDNAGQPAWRCDRGQIQRDDDRRRDDGVADRNREPDRQPLQRLHHRRYRRQHDQGG